MVTPNAYLAASTAVAAGAAVMQAQTFDLGVVERLGVSGLIVLGAVLMLKWAITQMLKLQEEAKADRALFREMIQKKDGEISELNEEMRKVILHDIRQSISIKAELNMTMKEHTKVIRDVAARFGAHA